MEGVDAVRGSVGGGTLIALRAKELAEDVGRSGSVGVAGAKALPLAFPAAGWISPLAAAILLVNDEMAHPAQPGALASGTGVLIRGVETPLVDAAEAGGSTVSGIVEVYFRILAIKMSTVLCA